MNVSNLEFAQEQIKSEFYSFKALLSEKAIHFFPGNLQHIEQKTPDLSYDGEEKGNSLAVIINERRVEIRIHKRFQQEQISKIITSLLGIPNLAFLAGKPILYGGKEIKP